MLSILHHQGDSRSSFGFTRKVLGGGDRDEGAKGDACAGGPGQGELHRVQNPAGLQPPAGVPLNFSAVPPAAADRLVIFLFFRYLKPKFTQRESQSPMLCVSNVAVL